MNGIHVGIKSSEMYMAVQAGILRTVENLYKQRKHKYGYSKGDIGWSISIDGGIAEYVVAKAFNLHWEGKGTLGGDDVGPYQVRHTEYDNGCLVLHPDDKDDKKYILVTGKGPGYVIRGWMYAKEGKVEKYWKEDIDRPAFFVPQSDIHPIETLDVQADVMEWKSK